MPLLLLLLLGGAIVLVTRKAAPASPLLGPSPAPGGFTPSGEPLTPATVVFPTTPGPNAPITTGHAYSFTAVMTLGGDGFTVDQFLITSGWNDRQDTTIDEVSGGANHHRAFTVTHAVRGDPSTDLQHFVAEAPFAVLAFREA